MKKNVIFLLLICCNVFIYAQKSEIGAFGGVSFYLGDLNPTTLFANVKPAGGLVYRYNFDARWALKANVIFANVEASDQKNNKNYERNLSFKSPITEISAQVEVNFFNLYNVASFNRFSPYVFAGIAFFSFNPQAELDGKTYFLQHLGTEGQGLPGQKKYYSLTNFAIPFGIGLKATIGRFIAVGVEWGLRYTFTDYLDDVGNVYYDNDALRTVRGNIVADLADRSEFQHSHGRERGNITTKDLYSFCGVIFTVKLGNEDANCDLRKNVRKRGGKFRY
ncbi:MAG: DUF6089 family protein [Bacteroidales bacterium]|jgi:hypothetical protein|nr:DUF6089 family protein [Bacteroidales bacterium]